jgi:hypothetical protein
MSANDFWIAVDAAIVGGLAGYVAAFFQSYRELKRRRRAIATALLADLSALETHLGDAHHNASPESLKSLPPISILGRFSDYVDVLSGETTHALSVVSATLDSLPDRFAELRKAHYRDRGLDGRSIPEYPDKWATEFVTTSALIAIENAYHLLIADGGKPQGALPIDSVSYPSLPDLPQRVAALIEKRWIPKRTSGSTRGDQRPPKAR